MQALKSSPGETSCHHAGWLLILRTLQPHASLTLPCTDTFGNVRWWWNHFLRDQEARLSESSISVLGSGFLVWFQASKLAFFRSWVSKPLLRRLAVSLVIVIVLLILGWVCFVVVAARSWNGMCEPTIILIRKKPQCKSQAAFFVGQHLWSLIFALALPPWMSSGDLATLYPSGTCHLFCLATANQMRVQLSGFDLPYLKFCYYTCSVKNSYALFSVNIKPPVVNDLSCDLTGQMFLVFCFCVFCFVLFCFSHCDFCEFTYHLTYKGRASAARRYQGMVHYRSSQLHRKT